MEPKEAVLYINKSESRCGYCNIGCDPYEESHITAVGWHVWNDKATGCGAVYTALSSDYIGWREMELIVREMRPDLPWIGN